MVLFWASAAFVATLAGGAFAYFRRRQLLPVMSLSAGMLIGVVFLDLIPEIAERSGSVREVMPILLAGFLAIFLLEKLTIIHGERDHDAPDHHHAVGIAGALGLIFHSVLDGFAIGSAFRAGTVPGLGVAGAVLAHDFADGLNTVTFMLATKNAPRRAIAFLLADAAAPIVGALIATRWALPPEAFSGQLAFFAGFLLYMGASDLLPHAHERPRISLLLITLFGMGTIWALVTWLEH
jgi:ZIP family zinc transporter